MLFTWGRLAAPVILNEQHYDTGMNLPSFTALYEKLE